MTEYEYKGHDVNVHRIENYHDQRPGMPHEMVAEIDGEEVMTATRLERTKDVKFEQVPNWTWALKLYVEAYIDGKHGC